MADSGFTKPNMDALNQERQGVGNADVGFDITLATKQFSLKDATIAAYEEICKGLSESIDPNRMAEASAFGLDPGGDLGALNVVLGVGLGLSESSEDMANEPGEGCIHLYTAEPVSKDIAINYAASAFGARALSSADVPVRVVHTGPIDLQPHRFKMRPAPGGISVGHINITAGTMGCLARGRQSPRDSRLLALSNNHVFANVNAAKIGDPILQPGPYDGGSSLTNQIGVLERFVRIDHSAPNYTDCATAWVDPDLVRPELVYIKGGQPQFFRVGNTPVPAVVGQTVGKSGRTTQLTAGRIIATGVNINVDMGGGKVAQFVNQIAIQGVSGNFSAGGDSGSLIWTWDSNRSPVGLLFAGGGGYTFANPIQTVLNALDINLYT